MVMLVGYDESVVTELKTPILIEGHNHCLEDVTHGGVVGIDFSNNHENY